MHRVRIVAAQPLPDIKAWFPLRRDGLDSVSQLKDSLCDSLKALRDVDVRPHDIVLLLDDFELLDETSADVLRDGDLLTIQRRPTSSKRKADLTDVTPSCKKIKLSPLHATVPGNTPGHISSKIPPVGASSSSSGSSEDTSSSESESDSSSDSDSSDSDSDSDSSLPSSSNLAPRVQSSKQPRSALNAASIVVAKSHHPLPVPPGQGKISTQSRNLRRRKKRLFERGAVHTAPTPPLISSSVNALPLGVPEAKRDVHAEPTIAMMSLSNKNKRKGFKRAMTGQLPTRITFELPDTSPAPASVSHPSSPKKRPYLVPPSQKQELGLLPANLFVTSVDVEAELWHSQKRKGKGPRAEPHSMLQDSHAKATLKANAADIVLPYDDETAVAPTGSGLSIVPPLDWNVVEAHWSSFPVVAQFTMLKIGNVVGWKELGIHPTTLTPETLLHLAHVVAIGDQVTVRSIARPGAGAVSFSVDFDVELEEEEVAYSAADVLSLGWRLVQTPA
ncbi:hypothetical protein FA95DRAFT_1664113 [Auriscalpium vulgare]|uniref:Uncharacterized protein n=1 Tax=Auriscalpium vulgare TaxID=40419 RepID=A0ACB8S7Q4_9AGAM|nr:hypothetical protein FA95DRAFT_1664113 [Auriscalpium vulgare]